MKRSQYLNRAQEAFCSGRVDEYTYDAMLMNADIFCDDDDDDEAPDSEDSTSSDDSRDRFEEEVREFVGSLLCDEERIVPLWNAHCSVYGDDHKRLISFTEINLSHPLHQFSCVGDVISMFESISDDSTYYTLTWNEKYVPVDDISDVICADELVSDIVCYENDFGVPELKEIINDYRKSLQ